MSSNGRTKLESTSNQVSELHSTCRDLTFNHYQILKVRNSRSTKEKSVFVQYSQKLVTTGNR